MQPGSCEGAPQLDIVSAFQSYGRFLEEGSTEAAEKTRYDTVRNSCRKEGGSCGGESRSVIPNLAETDLSSYDQGCTPPSE